VYFLHNIKKNHKLFFPEEDLAGRKKSISLNRKKIYDSEMRLLLPAAKL